jgi:hypothetical protein
MIGAASISHGAQLLLYFLVLVVECLGARRPRHRQAFRHIVERDDAPRAQKKSTADGELPHRSTAPNGNRLARFDIAVAGTLRDLQLIGAAQRVEHYEVAAYGTARAIAQHLELDEVVELLTQTFDEEAECDEKLSELADQLYAEADGGSEEAQDEGDDSQQEEVEEEAEPAVARKPAGKNASAKGPVPVPVSRR